MTLLLGCIADDSTGGADVALTLARSGMDVVQMLEIPSEAPPDSDAVVISLKTRTAPPAAAVEQSRAAARYLLDHGAERLYFKYCSTFDSTDDGNIGPVASALLDDVSADFTVFCPAFPATGRTVRDGHLFVHGQRLSESSMRDHPLTPMRDSDLVQVLGRQAHGREVGLVRLESVERGPESLRKNLRQLRAAGTSFAIVDAVTDDHLLTIGSACAELPLTTGASGVAMGLAEHLRRDGRLPRGSRSRPVPPLPGPVLIVSGSCSETTLAQVKAAQPGFPLLRIDPAELARDASQYDEIRRQVAGLLERHGSVVVSSSASPAEVRQVQQILGADVASRLLEEAMARLASDMVASGVRKLIVAGGETSGAVARALRIRQLRIGPEIDPGVPWTVRVDDPEMLIAFKSGNFGSEDFFRKAVEMIR